MLFVVFNFIVMMAFEWYICMISDQLENSKKNKTLKCQLISMRNDIQEHLSF